MGRDVARSRRALVNGIMSLRKIFIETATGKEGGLFVCSVMRETSLYGAWGIHVVMTGMRGEGRADKLKLELLLHLSPGLCVPQQSHAHTNMLHEMSIEVLD